MKNGMGKKAPHKSTKKNNDRRSQQMDPTSQSYEMVQKGLVNQIDPPNNKTKNNKAK